MGTKEKLIARFLEMPNDFTYEEVKRLFAIFGYEEGTRGSTSESRVIFESEDRMDAYIMHKPHPSNIIKGYVMTQMLDFINGKDLIKKHYKKN